MSAKTIKLEMRKYLKTLKRKKIRILKTISLRCEEKSANTYKSCPKKK